MALHHELCRVALGAPKSGGRQAGASKICGIFGKRGPVLAPGRSIIPSIVLDSVSSSVNGGAVHLHGDGDRSLPCAPRAELGPPANRYGCGEVAPNGAHRGISQKKIGPTIPSGPAEAPCRDDGLAEQYNGYHRTPKQPNRTPEAQPSPRNPYDKPEDYRSPDPQGGPRGRPFAFRRPCEEGLQGRGTGSQRGMQRLLS